MVLWQDKLKSLIQDPTRRGDHVTDTWATLLETKENRISMLERDCAMMEKEILQQQQQREQWLQTVEQQQQQLQQQQLQLQQQQLRHRSSTPVNTPPVRTGTPSSLQQQGVIQQQHYRNSPIPNGPTGTVATKEGVIHQLAFLHFLDLMCFVKMFHLTKVRFLIRSIFRLPSTACVDSEFLRFARLHFSLIQF